MSSTLDWANLFEEEAPRLMRFLRRFGPRISAEDIAQDAFAKVCAQAPKEIASPRAYLFRTARNLALNALRHNAVVEIQSVPDPDALALAATDPDPEEAAIRSEERIHLESALARLAPNQREALLLFKVEGLTHKEIGARMGVSHRSAQRYVTEALAACHLVLAPILRDE
jgi:RNA polymerase sigma factor (sigma-70 family)